MQNIINAYTKMVKNYTVYNGRTNVPDFWWAVLGNVIIAAVLNILGCIPVIGILFRIVSWLYGLAVLLPTLFIGMRRLHDTGKSGWFLLLGLIPAVGWIILIVFFAQPSQSEDNQFGPAGQSV